MGIRQMAKQHDQPYRLHKRGETWHAYISFIGSDGVRIQSRCSCGTSERGKAESFVIQKIAELQKKSKIQSGEYIEALVDEVFARHYREVAAYQSRPKQSLTMLKNLKSWLGVEYLHQISEPVISNIIATQRDRLSPATINRYLSLLSAVLNNSHKKWHYQCRQIHMEQFKLPEPSENITYIPNWKTAKTIMIRAPKWFRPIIYVGIKTGLRLGNLLNLKWSQVDFDNMVINIKVKSKRHPNGKNFSLPLLPDVANVIKSHKKISEYVFVSPTGKQLRFIQTAWRSIFYRWEIVHDTQTLTAKDVTLQKPYTQKDGKIVIKVYKQVLKDPELPYINFHSLRHTTGTWLSFTGANAMIIKDVLGHEDIRTSKKYVHANDQIKRQALLAAFSSKK